MRESIIEQSIRMLKIDPRDIIDVDYPDFEITEHMRSAMQKMPIKSRGTHLPVRITAGLFFTDEEWEDMRGGRCELYHKNGHKTKTDRQMRSMWKRGGIW